jgi:hypothetical protein
MGRAAFNQLKYVPYWKKQTHAGKHCWKNLLQDSHAARALTVAHVMAAVPAKNANKLLTKRRELIARPILTHRTSSLAGTRSSPSSPASKRPEFKGGHS